MKTYGEIVDGGPASYRRLLSIVALEVLLLYWLILYLSLAASGNTSQRDLGLRDTAVNISQEASPPYADYAFAAFQDAEVFALTSESALDSPVQVLDLVADIAEREGALDQVDIPRLSALEWEMWAKLNWERYSRGLDILDIDPSLVEIARLRSQGMIDGNYFSHSMPDGRNVFSLLDEERVPYRYAGENLARNNASDDISVGISVAAFMKSPSHRANILSPYYTRMGVGEITSSNGIKVYTILFLG